jgi:hypothetical protein
MAGIPITRKPAAVRSPAWQSNDRRRTPYRLPVAAGDPGVGGGLEEGRRLRSVRREVPGMPDVVMAIDLQVVNGLPECVGYHVQGKSIMTPGIARKVGEQAGAIIREVRAEILAPYRPQETQGDHDRSDRESFHALVAELYTKAVCDGSGSPVVDTAKELARLAVEGDKTVQAVLSEKMLEALRAGGELKVRTVSAWVARARAADHLPATTRGAAYA